LIALDTNVLVRVVTRDDPDQVAAALKLMESSRLFVTKTVLLELEWVLRYSYDLDRKTIGEALFRLLGLRDLEIEDRESVIRAHAWYVAGMDFADALHLAASSSAARLATFDRRFAKKAKELYAQPSVDLLGAATA